MKDIALLVGNDINNISPGISWKDLLFKITDFCGVLNEVIIHEKKPFPMLYEEIFLRAIRNSRIEEKNLKTFIAQSVSQITQNEIHEKIRSLACSHIMTTNYDFSLQGLTPKKNTSIVTEILYSIFRKNEVNGTTYWHLHGDSNNPLSINLGFEHYCGQLQNMRNYVVTGTNYSSPNVKKDSLIKRLTRNEEMNYQSWIDLFFGKDLHIFGLALDFVETDLWWLLTIRARSKFYKNKIEITNMIYYYIPEDFVPGSQYKIDLLKANDVEVIPLKEKNKLDYYHAIINLIIK